MSGFLSHKTSDWMPSDSSFANAASISVHSRTLRPATAFQPGISFPERQAFRAASSTSFSHLATSCPFFRYSPICSSVSSAGSVPVINASSTFFSARARHRPRARQYLHVLTPGAKSPLPWIARSARFFTFSPNARSSSKLHSHSDIPSTSLG